MGYQLTKILRKCEKEDIGLIITTLDSYVNCSDDQGLKELFQQWIGGIPPRDLIEKLETEIRYVGSSDIAYAYRKARRRNPAGIDVDEIIDDIAKALKISVKKAPLEIRLEVLVRAVFEKRVRDMSPKDQAHFLESLGLEEEAARKLLADWAKEKARIIARLLPLLGAKAVEEIVIAVVLASLTQFIGKKAAETLLKQFLLRFPWLAQWLGPLGWIITLTWLGIDLCGPACRKTIPIMLYLGLVALRDGPEEGEAFWSGDD